MVDSYLFFSGLPSGMHTHDPRKYNVHKIINLDRGALRGISCRVGNRGHPILPCKEKKRGDKNRLDSDMIENGRPAAHISPWTGLGLESKGVSI